MGLAGGAIAVGGQRLPASIAPPPPAELAAAGRAALATRPGEVEFVAEGSLGAVVRRRALLGEIVDYQLDVEGQPLRVQRSRHAPAPRAGEPCRVTLPAARWYPAGEEAGPPAPDSAGPAR